MGHSINFFSDCPPQQIAARVLGAWCSKGGSYVILIIAILVCSRISQFLLVKVQWTSPHTNGVLEPYADIRTNRGIKYFGRSAAPCIRSVKACQPFPTTVILTANTAWASALCRCPKFGGEVMLRVQLPGVALKRRAWNRGRISSSRSTTAFVAYTAVQRKAYCDCDKLLRQKSSEIQGQQSPLSGHTHRKQRRTGI